MGRGKRSSSANLGIRPNAAPEVRELANGIREWYLNGKLHRDDGPAVEGANGYRAWWLHGELHREDGPAVERADGTREWWLDDEELTETAHAAAVAELHAERAAEAAAAIAVRPSRRRRPSGLAAST